MKEDNSLPPIASLFKDSWEEFKKSVLNLFLLFLLSVATYVVVALALVMVFFLFGMGALLFSPGGMQSAFTNPLGVIAFSLGIILSVFAIVIITIVFQIASIRLVYNPEKKQSLIQLIKTSYPFVWPVFVVSFISGVLSLGGYGLLIIPGIIFSLFFSFSTYEALFNNQRGINALRRSYALFSTNFWGILGRLALFTLITIIISFAMPKNSSMGILTTLINIVIGWFSLCYSLALYKQVAKGNEQLPGKNITSIVIAAVIGFIILGLFAKTVIPAIGNAMNQDYEGQIPTQEEMNTMIEQLPQDESMKFEDKAI